MTSEGLDGAAAIVQVCNKLRLQLSEVFGVIGFRTLLHRSLAITRTETKCFENVSLDPTGVLLGLTEVDSHEQRALTKDAGVLLITNLLMLLEIFIGEGLAHTLLEESWPAAKSKNVGSKTQSQ